MIRCATVIALIALSASAQEITKPEGMPDDFKKALAKAESLELYSLEPTEIGEKSGRHFHGWKELGRTTLKGKAQSKLVAAFVKGVSEQDQSVVAACVFNPRHGIRVRSGGKTYDLVICFQCWAVRTYRGGEKARGFFGVSRTPAADFNQALQNAKVELPEKPKD